MITDFGADAVFADDIAHVLPDLVGRGYGRAYPGLEAVAESVEVAVRSDARKLVCEPSATEALRRPDGQMGAGPLYAVLNALARYLNRDRRSLAHVFGSAAEHYPSPLIPKNDVERFYKAGIDFPSIVSTVPASQLYEHFCHWCLQHQRTPVSRPKFARAFGDLGIQKARVAGRVLYVGIALRPTTVV